MYYIIKLYYFVAVLSLTYMPILPTFCKNKKVDKINNVKKRDQYKRRENVFYIYDSWCILFLTCIIRRQVNSACAVHSCVTLEWAGTCPFKSAPYRGGSDPHGPI